MDKKIKKFLWCSFIGVIIISAVIFTWLMIFMQKKTDASIAEVGEIYLSEMNKQLQQKFQSITDLRLEQLDAILESVPPDSSNDVDEILDNLIECAEVRDYIYLGFYTQDGGLEIIYGEKVEIVSADDIFASLEKDGKFIERGYNASEEKILLLGKAAEYEMADGRKSVALVAGLSMEYLNKALYLENEDTYLYSHIIDKNGEFVIRNSDMFRNNYFERINERFETLNGKNTDDYVRELSEAMEKGEDYYTYVSIDGEERNIYCSPLSDNSTWYLITVMPKGPFEHSIVTLDRVRSIALLGVSAIIIIMMSIIFVGYFRLSRQQMQEISKAREEAVHANNAKSEFLASMSHDIRTPMNAIIGMTDIALNNKQDAERVEECLTKVKLSSKHLIGLINDVLDMSKIESGKMTLNINQLSLRETMDDIVNIMQPQVCLLDPY
ncbi:MAG: response regulator, partial [Lachnospiraceae bacterium]|nr:response regulator [Lachnospiraceae bacterium]